MLNLVKNFKKSIQVCILLKHKKESWEGDGVYFNCNVSTVTVVHLDLLEVSQPLSSNKELWCVNDC